MPGSTLRTHTGLTHSVCSNKVPPRFPGVQYSIVEQRMYSTAGARRSMYYCAYMRDSGPPSSQPDVLAGSGAIGAGQGVGEVERRRGGCRVGCMTCTM